jgi:hypothetical protein
LFTLFWFSVSEVSHPDLISRNQSQFLFPKSASSCCPSPFFLLVFLCRCWVLFLVRFVWLLLPTSSRVQVHVRSLCRTVPLSRSLRSVKLPVRLLQVLAALSLVIFLTLTCTAPAKPVSCSKWLLLLVSLLTLVSLWCSDRYLAPGADLLSPSVLGRALADCTDLSFPAAASDMCSSSQCCCNSSSSISFVL